MWSTESTAVSKREFVSALTELKICLLERYLRIKIKIPYWLIWCRKEFRERFHTLASRGQFAISWDKDHGGLRAGKCRQKIEKDDFSYEHVDPQGSVRYIMNSPACESEI